jgi:hypothetical protein
MSRQKKSCSFTLDAETILKVDRLSRKYNTQRSMLVDSIVAGFYDEDLETDKNPSDGLKGKSVKFNLLPLEKQKHLIIEFLARRKGKSTGAILDDIISEYFANHNEEIKS